LTNNNIGTYLGVGGGGDSAARRLWAILAARVLVVGSRKGREPKKEHLVWGLEIELG
jgi:hypothetical protein